LIDPDTNLNNKLNHLQLPTITTARITADVTGMPSGLSSKKSVVVRNMEILKDNAAEKLVL
jgi:hypothetical protein